MHKCVHSENCSAAMLCGACDLTRRSKQRPSNATNPDEVVYHCVCDTVVDRPAAVDKA